MAHVHSGVTAKYAYYSKGLEPVVMCSMCICCTWFETLLPRLYKLLFVCNVVTVHTETIHVLDAVHHSKKCSLK